VLGGGVAAISNRGEAGIKNQLLLIPDALAGDGVGAADCTDGEGRMDAEGHAPPGPMHAAEYVTSTLKLAVLEMAL
jgi:hypothetical protein